MFQGATVCLSSFWFLCGLLWTPLTYPKNHQTINNHNCAAFKITWAISTKLPSPAFVRHQIDILSTHLPKEKKIQMDTFQRFWRMLGSFHMIWVNSFYPVFEPHSFQSSLLFTNETIVCVGELQSPFYNHQNFIWH